MSDTQVSNAPPVLEPDAPTGSDRRRKLLIGAGVGVALLVVLGLAYVLFFSGGGSEEAALVVTPGTPTTSETGPATTPAAPSTFNGDLGRNPFQPLAAEATPVAASTAPAAPTTAPAVDPTSAAGLYTVGVTSVNVKKGKADITVNGAPYTVSPGDTVPDGASAQITITSIGTNSDVGGPYVGMQLGDGPVALVGVGMTAALS
jgi:hypothetical protein